MTHPGFSSDLPAVFPDWSPYPDLDSAARAYLRDPDLALDALGGVLAGAGVLCFTLGRFVNDTNGVWQEVAVCDGSRLVLWHGEDVPPGEGPMGSMTSSVRVLPLSAVTEVGTRRRLQRTEGGVRVDAVDVYVLLSSFDDGTSAVAEEHLPPVRQDALRFVKTLDDGGAGQIARLEEFARIISAMVGRPF
ncbi:MAG: hypothetical protein QOE61_5854 [Micromonosporaceae bacterium]|nr:hypothetical protein [Micromonosporaceae bacterium]